MPLRGAVVIGRRRQINVGPCQGDALLIDGRGSGVLFAFATVRESHYTQARGAMPPARDFQCLSEQLY